MPVYLRKDICPWFPESAFQPSYRGKRQGAWSILKVDVDSFPGVLYRRRFQYLTCPEELTLTPNAFKLLCLMQIGGFRFEAIAEKIKGKLIDSEEYRQLFWNSWRKCMGIEPTREAINPSHRIWSPGGPPVPYPLPARMVNQKQARILIGVDHENNSLL